MRIGTRLPEVATVVARQPGRHGLGGKLGGLRPFFELHRIHKNPVVLRRSRIAKSDGEDGVGRLESERVALPIGACELDRFPEHERRREKTLGVNADSLFGLVAPGIKAQGVIPAFFHRYRKGGDVGGRLAGFPAQSQNALACVRIFGGNLGILVVLGIVRESAQAAPVPVSKTGFEARILDQVPALIILRHVQPVGRPEVDARIGIARPGSARRAG